MQEVDCEVQGGQNHKAVRAQILSVIRNEGCIPYFVRQCPNIVKVRAWDARPLCVSAVSALVEPDLCNQEELTWDVLLSRLKQGEAFHGVVVVGWRATIVMELSDHGTPCGQTQAFC